MGKGKKVLLIGNNGHWKPIFDGQRGKTRLYFNILKKEGFDVTLIDLDGWKKHIVSILMDIKRNIKKCDFILLMAAQKGSRTLIPYINFLNRKNKKKFIYSQIGNGVIIRKKIKKPYDFFVLHQFDGYKDKRMEKHLKKIDVILPETDIISRCYEKLFELNNCITLTNFKDVSNSSEHISTTHKKTTKIVYFARVEKKKGIFDLLNAMCFIHDKNVFLDIYGMNQLTKKEMDSFNSLLKKMNNVKYLGQVDQNNSLELLSQYDFMCFTTHYPEGVPGTIVEALLVGLPIISSNFVQSSELLKDGVDSIIYRVGDVPELTNDIKLLISDKEKLSQLKTGALKNGKRFTYEYNRNLFLSIFSNE